MTIRDVAAYSGVSVSTVSRVLNDHPDVSKDVRERVLKAVKELHYVPNASARDLVKTAGDSIGVVVRGAENPFFTPVIRAIEQAVEQAGYTLSIRQVKPGDDELGAAARLARSKKLKGLILLGGRYDYTEEDVALIDIPFVCCTYTNSFGTIDSKRYSSVSIDDREEARKAVEYLTGCGHRKIAVLMDSASDRSISELRYKGYLDALREAGIKADKDLLIESVNFNMVSAYESARRFAASGKEFSALFAIADSFAIAAMKAFHDEGLIVPEDCSVIAIDGINMSLYTIPTLTTLVQPKEELGREAVKILTDVLEGKPHRHVRLTTKLRKGGTVQDLK
jgi:LacI family transcriptional regulator